MLTSLLNNTFSVEKPIRASDGKGGWAVAYEDVGTVEGRIAPQSGRESVVADQEEQQVSHVLYTATLATSGGETLARGCLVTVDDLTVEVLGIREPSEAGHHWEIDCLERQAESLEDLGS